VCFELLKLKGHGRASSMSAMPGLRSGRSGPWLRAMEKGEAWKSCFNALGLSQVSNTLQGVSLVLWPDGSCVDAKEMVGTGLFGVIGVGGRGLLPSGTGCNGVVRINDLNERTGRSIPLREDTGMTCSLPGTGGCSRLALIA
jgi:hypothetical protein